MSAAARAILESRLAKLLGTGVDDDLDELLDSFIDMESVDDVIEYLSNFVVDAGGDGHQDLNEFAVDVVKYGLGEYNVLLSDDATSFDDDRKPSAAASSTTTMANTESKQSPNVKVRDEAAVQREVIKRREMEARERQRIKNREDEGQRRWNEVKATATRNEKQSGNTRRQQQQGGQNNHLQPIQSSSSSFVATSESNVSMQVAAVSTSKTMSIPPVVIKHDPRAGTKGKPMKESCGCYGTKCNAITNCLNCGRISCDTEGINDYCHFCNIWIGELQFTASSTNNVITINDPATRHKERLLEYDRTAAARTLIHDDQEDYYSAANSMWSSEQEREDNRLKEESRQHNLHERKKPVLNVKF